MEKDKEDEDIRLKYATNDNVFIECIIKCFKYQRSLSVEDTVMQSYSFLTFCTFSLLKYSVKGLTSEQILYRLG